MVNGTSLPHYSSPFHDEDIKHGHVTPDMHTIGVKHDRLWWDQDKDDTSKEKDEPEDMEDDEEEPREEAKREEQEEILKHIRSNMPMPMRMENSTFWDVYSIHKSVEEVHKESLSRATSSRRLMVNAHMSTRPPEGWTQKVLADPDIFLKAHPIKIDERIRKLKVYVNASPIHHHL